MTTTALSGMKAIRDFCRSINLSSTEASVINMIKTCNFPARKIGGIWESDQESIKMWRKKYIEGEIEPEKPAAPEKNCQKQTKGVKDSMSFPRRRGSRKGISHERKSNNNSTRDTRGCSSLRNYSDKP